MLGLSFSRKMLRSGGIAFGPSARILTISGSDQRSPIRIFASASSAGYITLPVLWLKKTRPQRMETKSKASQVNGDLSHRFMLGNHDDMSGGEIKCYCCAPHCEAGHAP